MNPVYIYGGRRIPTGKFSGAYKNISAVDLGAELVRKIVKKYSLRQGEIDGLYVGNVVSAGLGQHPAGLIKQKAGLWYSVDATGISKVCSSGMVSIKMGHREIEAGDMEVVIAGGVESMSRAPLLLMRPHVLYDPEAYTFTLSQLRERFPEVDFNDPVFIDSLQADGLCDGLSPVHPVMGAFAEGIIRDHKITRDMLDAYAYESYYRAGEARNKIQDQFIYIDKAPLEFDEGWRKPNLEKMKTLRPVFGEGCRLTGANSSQLSDGAAFLVLVSEKKKKYFEQYYYEQGVMARIVGFGHAGRPAREFLLSPVDAIRDVLKKTGIALRDIDLLESNEAFPPSGIFLNSYLGIDYTRINIWGGAIANGHPLGASGAKILLNLCYALKATRGRYGITVICNGGGEAVSILIENYMR